MLSHGLEVNNITIRNIFGSFYTYCVSMTKYHGSAEERGTMISIENVSACASEGTADVPGGRFPFIWIEKGMDVENLRIAHVYRKERTFPTPTVQFDEGTYVNKCILQDIVTKNELSEDFTDIRTDGKIDRLIQENVFYN